MPIIVDDSVRALWSGEAVVAVCQARHCRCGNALDADFDAEVANLLAALREGGKQYLEESRVLRVRAAFHRIPRMDPTRHRPSSEALIRRYLRGDFFRINPYVDICNFLSARLRIPLGLYDLGKTSNGPWVLRLGFAGETYITISGMEKTADGKLVLADDAGVFGCPVNDSRRTATCETTRDVAVVAFLPFETSCAEAGEIAHELELAYARFAKAEQTELSVVARAG